MYIVTDRIIICTNKISSPGLSNVRCVHFFAAEREAIKKEPLGGTVARFEESPYSDPNFMIHLSKSTSRSCCQCVDRVGFQPTHLVHLQLKNRMSF